MEKIEALRKERNHLLKKGKFLLTKLVILLVSMMITFYYSLETKISMLLILALALFIITGLVIRKLKSIVFRDKFLKEKIDDIVDRNDRTQKGILTIVNGEKIESLYVTPKYKDDPYLDLNNNVVYYKDKIVSFEYL